MSKRGIRSVFEGALCVQPQFNHFAHQEALTLSSLLDDQAAMPGREFTLMDELSVTEAWLTSPRRRGVVGRQELARLVTGIRAQRRTAHSPYEPGARIVMSSSHPGALKMFMGAQIGIRCSTPRVDGSRFLDDLNEAQAIYPTALARYETNGISRGGAAPLFAAEYARILGLNPSASFLDFRHLFLPGRPLFYGYLEVATFPDRATVKVDENDWGESPVAERRIPAGSYSVTAQKDGLTGFDKAVVEAGARKGVTITLH